MTYKPKLSREDKNLGLSSNRVFIYVFILEKIIKDDYAWGNFMEMLNRLVERHPYVKLSHFGFPENWRALLL